MIKVFYKCDRCEKQDDDNKMQLWVVCVRYQSYSKDSQNLYSALSSNSTDPVQWCRECSIKMGIPLGSLEERKSVTNELPPTIEDMIREIVRQEMEPLKQ